MFSQEKLSVQSLCISPCFQWVSPLKTRSCRTQNKNFSSLNLKLFLFLNTAIGCLPIPGTLRWNILAHYFSHNPALNRVGFPKEGLNLTEDNTMKKNRESKGCRQNFTAHTADWQFLFLHVSFPAFLKRGSVLERASGWKADHNKNFLFHPHEIRKEWALVLCLQVRWRKQDFPLLLPEQDPKEMFLIIGNYYIRPDQH